MNMKFKKEEENQKIDANGYRIKISNQIVCFTTYQLVKDL